MIIHERNEVLYQIYRCPKCNDVYKAQTGAIRISCAVMHPPGSCCHYGEVSVTDEQLSAIHAVFNTNTQKNTALEPTQTTEPLQDTE